MADDQRSGDPPYRVIAAVLRERIEACEFAPGDALPSITRLAQEYGVAKTTAQKALRVLVDEGLARGVQGWGTIVAERGLGDAGRRRLPPGPLVASRTARIASQRRALSRSRGSRPRSAGGLVSQVLIVPPRSC